MEEKAVTPKSGLYRDNKKLERGKPKSFDDCKTWWDAVVYFFLDQLDTVSFLVERQEEIIANEP